MKIFAHWFLSALAIAIAAYLIPLDHIFISSHWEIENLKTIAFGSDHLALLIDASRMR